MENQKEVSYHRFCYCSATSYNTTFSAGVCILCAHNSLRGVASCVILHMTYLLRRNCSMSSAVPATDRHESMRSRIIEHVYEKPLLWRWRWKDINY